MTVEKFLYPEYGLDLSPNLITLWSGPIHIKKFHEDVFISFGVITNTDKRMQKQCIYRQKPKMKTFGVVSDTEVSVIRKRIS